MTNIIKIANQQNDFTMKKIVFLIILTQLSVHGLCQGFVAELFPEYEVDYAKEQLLQKMSCNDSVLFFKDRLQLFPLYRVTPSDHCPDSVFPIFWWQSHNCYADSLLFSKENFLSDYFFSRMVEFKHKEQKQQHKNYYFIKDFLIYDPLDKYTGLFYTRNNSFEPYLSYFCEGKYGKSIIQLLFQKEIDYLFECRLIGHNSSGYYLNDIPGLLFAIKGENVIAILPNDGTYIPKEKSDSPMIILSIDDFKTLCWEQFAN